MNFVYSLLVLVLIFVAASANAIASNSTVTGSTCGGNCPCKRYFFL